MNTGKKTDISIRPIIKHMKTDKNLPEKLGDLLEFYCPTCGERIAGLFEADFAHGGGFRRSVTCCEECNQALDFTGYYAQRE